MASFDVVTDSQTSPTDTCAASTGTMLGMPVPEFIRNLRQHVGHEPLWLSGVSAVVREDAGRILLTRRADNDRWAVVSGVLEPGEDPAPAVLREIAEETGVTAEVIRMTSVDVTPMISYPNGDRARYLDICFLARHVGGDPHPADDENTAVDWFSPAVLPDELTETSRLRIDKALRDVPETWFRH